MNCIRLNSRRNFVVDRNLSMLLPILLCTLYLTLFSNAAYANKTTSPLPLLKDCASLNTRSPSTAEDGIVQQQQCNSSSPTLLPPIIGQSIDTDFTDVKSIAEAVLEVIPTQSQHNFALDKDGAKVLASNPGAKRVNAILDDDGDTFMRNECKDDKWVVIELSQVAKVSRMELVQHELYSSRIKQFEVRGRQSHPRTDNVETSKGLDSTSWKSLGTFTAEKAKGTQSFTVDAPLWVRYLLVRFLSHFGSESVCAVNGIAVYGTCLMLSCFHQLLNAVTCRSIF